MGGGKGGREGRKGKGMTRKDTEGRDQEADDGFRDEPIYEPASCTKDDIIPTHTRRPFRPLPESPIQSSVAKAIAVKPEEFQSVGRESNTKLTRVFALVLIPAANCANDN